MNWGLWQSVVESVLWRTQILCVMWTGKVGQRGTRVIRSVQEQHTTNPMCWLGESQCPGWWAHRWKPPTGPGGWGVLCGKGAQERYWKQRRGFLCHQGFASPALTCFHTWLVAGNSDTRGGCVCVNGGE